jgi:hypothetical protein
MVIAQSDGKGDTRQRGIPVESVVQGAIGAWRRDPRFARSTTRPVVLGAGPTGRRPLSCWPRRAGARPGVVDMTSARAKQVSGGRVCSQLIAPARA